MGVGKVMKKCLKKIKSKKFVKGCGIGREYQSLTCWVRSNFP